MISGSTHIPHSTPSLSIVLQLKRQLQQGQARAFVECQSNHGLWGPGPCTPHSCLKKTNVNHSEGIRHKYLQQPPEHNSIKPNKGNTTGYVTLIAN